ncbi:MAG TPA: ATP-binding protein [Acidimicrobiales bacterium]|nr:ATP-binding protein [Acidimicrobiales bacterium]
MPRGELRIYIGAAPGVGKTFAMLHEGRRRRDRGTDVVVGFVETHGRPATAAAVGDLEVVPRRVVPYRGVEFEEMDTDAVLARAPQVALVDELAHTDVPGSRHEKRWQDIEELLAAGITVISTVNIQHLESLNDVIERITGVVQRERVPDAVVRAADQIELVDMTPEALRRRMAHGNIYKAEKVDAALGHYFRVGNLAALRELALLWVADRVEEGIDEYRERHGINEVWETRERVVVALTGAPGGEQLLRRGARMAGRARGELIGVHVRTADGREAPDEELLDRHRALLEQMGGRYAEVTGDDAADALVHFAKGENATQLVLGASNRSRLREFAQGSVINRVIRQSAPIDVHVISSGLSPTTPVRPRRRGRRAPAPRPPRARAAAWLAAFVGIPAIVVAFAPFKSAIGVPGLLLGLLLAPVSVAVLGGLGPALTASAVAFVFADWLYIEPTRSLRFAHAGDAFALVVFMVVSALVSGLVDRLARHSAQLARSQAETEALAQLASGTALLDSAALTHLVDELHQALGFDGVSVLAPTPDGWRVDAFAGEPIPTTPDGASYSAELGNGALLVVRGASMAAADRRLLSAFVSQLRVAQDSMRLQAAALESKGLAEGNRIREAILAAVSHDLRGPLAGIKAAATSLLSRDVVWPAEQVRAFCETIDQESERLNSVVTNLLDMGRLQAQMVGLRIEPTSVEEVIWAALATLSADVSRVEVVVPEDLPPVYADAALLERAVANVALNAINWAPQGTPVRVEAGVAGGRVVIRVVDRGAGIPRDQRAAVFQPFQRLGDGGNAFISGIGLGLAVTKGFVEAMDGDIAIDDTPGGGTTMSISLGLAA